jgi:nucleotide-binding universal stress UspA family protein
MFQIKRILFPVDFSDKARKAAVYAGAMAARFDAELIMIHIVEPPQYNTSLADSHGSQWEHFGSSLSGNHLRIKRLTEHGDEAAPKIIHCAKTHHADLIVMPTHGLGMYRRLILGSTTAKVLHDADCPVWTGAHLENASPREDIGRICCAVDLKPHSVKVLEWAHQVATKFQAEMILVHVGPTDLTMHDIDDLQKSAGSSATVRVEEGDPAKTVARISAEFGSDLLVIGRGAEAGIMGRLEATAYSIIRQSHCPVVSV